MALASLATGLMLPGFSAQDRAVRFPVDWSSVTLDDCEQAIGWQPAGHDGELPKRFLSLRVTHSIEARALGKASCRCELRLADAVPEWVELRSTLGPIRRCDALSIWVKNPEGRAALLGLKVTDADNAEYLAPTIPLGDERNWYELAFYLRDFSLAPLSVDARPGVDFPLRGVSLMLGGLRGGVRYLFYFDELRAHAAPLWRADVIELVTPREVEAGSRLPVRLRLRALTAITSDLDVMLSLSLNGAPACSRHFRIGVPEGGAAPSTVLPPTEGALDLPPLLAPGTYDVTLACDRAEIILPSRERLPTSQVRVKRSETTPTTSAVEAVGGVPMIKVRGTPLRVAHAMWDVSDEQAIAALANLQPQAVRFRICLGGQEPGCASVAWVGRDRYEFWDLDATLSRILVAAPQAMVLPDVHVTCPAWWAQTHPDELMVLMTEGGTRVSEPMASFSSVVWREDAAAALTALIAHLENGPFADHIIGYQVSSGFAGRWLYPDMARQGLSDYSAPQREAFREWAKDKYGRLENLRSAWGQPIQPAAGRPGAVTGIMDWAQTSIPGIKHRTNAATWLIDPVSGMAVVDYRLFASRAITDTIGFLLERAKAACGGNKVCGVAYGHFMELASRHKGLEEGGHLALGTLLGLAPVDFVVGPPAEGHPGAVLMPVASVLKAGKAYLPSLSGEAAEAWESAAASLESGAPSAVAPAPPGLEAERLENLEPGSAAEVAVVVDDVSAAFFAYASPVKKLLLTQQMDEIRRLGAPVDVWLLEDILRRRAPNYRLYIFLNVFHLTSADARALAEALPGTGEYTLWFCAPGAVGSTFSGRLMMTLTGIAGSASLQPGPLTVRVAGLPAAGATDLLTPPMAYGLTTSVAPQFQVVDPHVTVMGTGPQGEPALVKKQVGKRTSLYSMAPQMPADLLRAIAREAGVHIYNERSDRFYATPSWVAISVMTGGKRYIRLPRRAEVYELPGGGKLPGLTDEIVVDLPAGATRLFVLRSEASG